MTKTCSKCRQEQALSAFGKHSRSPDGLHPRCCGCVNAARRAYVSSRPEYQEKMRERCRRWHAENTDVARARAKAHYHENKDRHRSTRLLRKYGISLIEYDVLLAAQGGKCAICGRERPTRGDQMLQVDHCHRTGKVRGLLCSPCNTVLGFLEDNPQALQAAIVYLAEPPARRLSEEIPDA
jgi:hypothetical protein